MTLRTQRNYLDRAESDAAVLPMPSGQKITTAREETLVDRLGQRVRSRLYEMCRTVEIFCAGLSPGNPSRRAHSFVKLSRSETTYQPTGVMDMQYGRRYDRA